MTRKPVLMLANWRPPRDPSFKDASNRKFLRETLRGSPRASPDSIAPPSLFHPHGRLSNSRSRSRLDRSRLPYYMELNKRHEIQVNTHGYSPTVNPNDLKYPVLEELMQMPILRTEGLRAEVLTELRNFRVPVLQRQIERSLAYEFGRRIIATATDWSQFEDPLSGYEEAARCIKTTFAALSNRAPKPDKAGKYTLADFTRQDILKQGEENEAWIREECEVMLREIQTGDYSRWMDYEKLVQAELTEEQRAMVMPAVEQLGANPTMHPRIKREVLSHICAVIREATATTTVSSPSRDRQ